MSRLHLTQHSWLVNKSLAKAVSIEASVLYSHLMDVYSSTESESMIRVGELYYFKCTGKNIEKETTLSYHKQKICIEALKKTGHINTVLKGVPAQTFFTILEY